MQKLIATTSVILSYNIEYPIIYLCKHGLSLACNTLHGCVLDVLQANQVSVEFQYRSGYCGACRLRLITGEVKYHQAPIAFIGSQEILPCCCLPVNDIEIEL